MPYATTRIVIVKLSIEYHLLFYWLEALFAYIVFYIVTEIKKIHLCEGNMHRGDFHVIETTLLL
jgi:hypothetical protein